MSRLFTFLGGDAGPWRVVEAKTIVGGPLPDVSRISIVNGVVPVAAAEARWALRGVTSNERYVTRPEKEELLAKQPTLGRPEAVCAALILLRKNAAWWSMTQDERRTVFEERSEHIRVGLKYLPAVARRLHHCRDLGDGEQFDFITWFEYAPANAAAFTALTAELRASDEWKYVEREIDIRLVRESV